MAIRVAIDHRTEYRYDRPVRLSPQIVRLRPAPHSRTPILSYSLKVEPRAHFINWQQDPFGNYLARLMFPEKTRQLRIDVDLVAEMTAINPFDFFLEDYAQYYPFQYDQQLAKELGPYREGQDSGPRLRRWLDSVDRSRQHIISFLVELNRKLQREIDYIVRVEPGVQSCEETLRKGTGSCRDTAWLLVEIARHLGFGARFVSGYLVQFTSDVKSLDGPAGPEQDFTDLHAWAEIYGAGWLGLDPTSGLFAGEGHIPLACTPDPMSAAPVTGSVDECQTQFYHHNRVKRIYEGPRVTRPYSEEQWGAIMALGRSVDRHLNVQDVRLSMGGEPTFVSIDDMESAEWNTEALGAQKRQLAEDLFWRLFDRFAPGGLPHHGQGKWYPNEALPRWALSGYWRVDGKPVWVDRLLRNLLVDVTGNTHRAEFCIDKLYPPDKPNDRRGIVELRAFEMSPHPRMSALQMLLLRALIARFWQWPYKRKLIRWGMELHDRFMLPHFVWDDLKKVVVDLHAVDYMFHMFQMTWFAPFLEFRFPRYGRITAHGMELELRGAIEPWHVLGEETTARGTARFVDSALERLQVKVNGMLEERYTVTCNGRRIPLQPTGRAGEYVAAVRFKAWQPPCGLHPTMPAQTPLVFDIVDTVNQRAIAGCTYHVSHPDRRNYQTFPVNANEAEARRIARFWPHGHSQGPIELALEEPNVDYPYTLDLRYKGYPVGLE